MTGEPIPPAQAARLEFLADALDVLIRLHDREVDRSLLMAMQRHRVAQWMARGPGTPAVGRAAADLEDALSGIGLQPDAVLLDALAAEYADIYLTHAYRVAPCGSVWLTEDRLERQLPMFEVRDWYAHYDITVPNWRRRADDHLVHELQFVSFLCRQGTPVAVADAARFLDLHVLSWVPQFCVKGAGLMRQPLYRALARLTAAVLEDLRSLLEEMTGSARQVRALPDPARPEPEENAYVPGLAESW
ncbi:TorA maturation chaperone TorD [Rhodovulum imhoffii]|uniref:TorA maturation chaperone TorD n=1 Tax=Rhodovulum imhoffii TaxID=365340 RepID=A0A2T5BQL2_9RHOB|nr:molecular chaperone TorD family protein [Rhodovulum imhoffii]MBK5934285.1 hypothetical protein [Rhodovulum imhoffii]PTN01440.1 TorA maturation chaperone TorD [Rhodovulum imhoffii]